MSAPPLRHRTGRVAWEAMRILPCCLALTVFGTPLHAQGLEDLITDLFIFGEGGDVLFRGGSGGSENPAVQVHGGRGLNRTRSE